MHGYALKTAKYFNRENFGSFKFVRSPIQVILAQINFWRIGKIRHEVKRWVWRLTESLWQDLAASLTRSLNYFCDGVRSARLIHFWWPRVKEEKGVDITINPAFNRFPLSCDVLRCTILVLTTSLEFSNSYKVLFAPKSMYVWTSDMKRWQEIIDGWQKCGSCVG